jgi:YggT family protein
MSILISLVTTVGFLFELCLMGRAIFSWIEPYPKNPVHRFLFRITEPVIAPVRRVIPAVGGIDLSFLVVMLGVGLVIRLVSQLGFY